MVNNVKVLNSNNGNIREQNVVMGMSMGGLVARYALARMTKNNLNSEARLLITHDSPHKGANVPLGLQYLIRMMGNVRLFNYNVYDIYPQYDEAINLFDSPDAKATKQLLIYQSTDTNTYANNSFLDGDYRNMITFSPSDPQPLYRFIATSQGSECAHPLFDPGKTFINVGAGIGAGIYARFLFFSIPIVTYTLGADVEAYALPSVGTTAKIARLYTINQLQLFGFINIFKQLYNNIAFSSGTQLPVDGVPGSVRPFFDVKALQALTDLPKFNPISISIGFSLGPVLAGYVDIYAHNGGFSPEFTFVPVACALDAAPYTTPVFSQTYVNGTNQNYPSTSETFIAQETNTSAGTTNNVHIRFTARNSRWLFNEMENLANLENCSSECANPFYIAGSDPVCSVKTFTVPGLQRGVGITWTITPSGLVTQSGTGNSITLTRNGTSAGVITLTANIGAGCSPATTISRQVTIGNPDPPVGTTYVTSNYYYTSRNEIITPQFWFMPAGQTGYVTYYISDVRYTPISWSIISGNTPIISADKRTLYFTINTGQTASYQLTAQGPCGTFIKNFGATVLQGSSFRVASSPNPASESLKITISNESEELKALRKNENIIFRLYEFNTNNLAKEWSYKNNQMQFTLKVTELKKGQYILVVSKGKYRQSQQIIIDR